MTDLVFGYRSVGSHQHRPIAFEGESVGIKVAKRLNQTSLAIKKQGHGVGSGLERPNPDGTSRARFFGEIAGLAPFQLFDGFSEGLGLYGCLLD